jgi:hypothetical protein
MTYLIPVLFAAFFAVQHHAPTGDAMGFDPDAVVHHFVLTPHGGVISVEARNVSDAKTIDAIHMHLGHIATMFADGNFDAPFVTHGENPAGVETMQRLKTAIRYAYRRTKDGGQVDISTDDGAALAAIHDFLRYQITEHKTGDPMTVGR